MPVKTGKEYIERIDRAKANVWVDGKQVQGKISEHPAFKGVMQSQASLYELQHDDKNRDVMTYTSPSTGDAVGVSFMIPKSKEDLERRRLMIQEWAKRSGGMMGRSPDYMNTVIMTIGAAANLFAKEDPKFAQHAANVYEHCRENDISLTHTFVQPQVNRSQSHFFEMEKEIIAAQMIDKTDAGIVIHGARLLATQGGTTDEILVFPSGVQSLNATDDNPYAYAFCVPNNTPGLKFIGRESFDYGKSHFDHPLGSRFEEMDMIVVFDHVTVPWDRVFMAGNSQLASEMMTKTSFSQHAMHQVVSRHVVKVELILGILDLLMDTINIGEYQHVQEKMSEVIIAHETLKGLLTSSEVNAKVDRWGVMTPDNAPLLSAVNYSARMFPRISEIIQSLGASGLVTIPSEADFHSESLRPDLDRYLQAANADALDRVKLFRLAWDVSMSAFGTRQVQYERYFFGDPVRLAGRLVQQTERSEYAARVKSFLSKE